MTKKNISLIGLVLLLGGLSLYLNRDRFKSAPIQISYRSMPPRWRPAGRRRTRPNATDPVIFMFSKELRLTSVKVVLVSDAQTNKYPHAIWNLVSDSKAGSAPVKDFVYGRGIRGMKPAVKGLRPEPLKPGVKYRLLIKTGSLKAEHDFTPVPLSS